MPALGERFRAAREARGLSLSDVSEQIRIRSVYLAAIEDENWPSIGAPVYIRGFLRTYARFLGLDPEDVVAAFNGAPAAAPGARPAAAPESAPAPSYTRSVGPPAAPVEPPRRRGSLAIWAAGLVALLLVGFVVYNEWMFRHQGNPAVAESSASASPAPSTSSATPEPSPTPAPGIGVASSAALSAAMEEEASLAESASTEVADGPNTLDLTLTAPSWLRITVDGNVSMEGTFPAGTSKTFHGKSASVRVGNAGGVVIRIDGKDVGKLGHPGDVVERSFTL
ncbi:MAG: helix-turn-helix domain-containing protein [Candidatus Eremiobacteraeota bacterium]|nr:helix-turn-helix domain-containing protein [Candidatus Eremiobacteraeota bacterium]